MGRNSPIPNAHSPPLQGRYLRKVIDSSLLYWLLSFWVEDEKRLAQPADLQFEVADSG
ncbi:MULTISPECIES: hypothetical protein [unclassified Nostoc]|uniref:hypothetical protein n=1 Tax=unclassified Nostoc TaxID=2593658 RepID=UPI00159EFE33|nr:hypothetical protein [Nostoc sp. KVJ20]